ncbi:MAG: zinc-dependent metalloprotease family protein, partial [Planctomycetota bacterium]|nr:zinc-dependent metalloprotease family protein [Planctomycetota bacterium]
MYTLLSTLALAAAPQAVDPVGSIQKLDVPTDPAGTVVIAVDIEGRKAEMVLDTHSVRASDFKLWVTRPDGSVLEVPAPEPNTYRGTIPGWPSASVIASINHEGLTAIVVDEQADEEWQIQPARGYAEGFYSVANKADLIVPTGVCGVPNMPGPSPEEVHTSSNASRGTGLQLCELALDADFEFFGRNGNSVSATLDDMERVVNRMDTIYVRDVDVTFQITGVVIRTTSNDPYTSNDAGTRLDQFRSHWNSNFSGVRRDLAHLFTGVNIAGGTIGVAYLGQVCTSVGYGLSESRFTANISSRTGLTAHEIGHNFSSNHCDGNGDCRIMC